MRLSILLGPLADIVTYFAAIGAGASADRAQAVSFLVAAAVIYLPQVRREAGANGPRWVSTLSLHVTTVSLLAFSLRIGVFALLVGRGWSGQAAIVFAVIATAGVLRPGYEYCIAFPRWALGGGAGWRAGAIGVIALAWALRVVYSGQVELLPEETYYWNYSRHLDWGYLDHPPMVAWLIGAGTAVFGRSEFGVRSGALACGVIASLFTYRLTRNLFDEPSALVAAVLLQSLPFFFLTGMLMTPDAPLMAAWVAALYFLERALIGGRGEAWWGAGLCLGLGLLSKYTIALLGLSTLLFMLTDSHARRWFGRAEPYGAALLALAIFAPVIVWNARHEWASFAFQTSRRLASEPRFALHKLLASILVLLTPTGVAAAASLLRRTPQASTRQETQDLRRAWRFIQCAIFVPLAVFAAFSLRHEVKLDWTGAPWTAALPVLAFGIVQSAQTLASGFRGWIRESWVPTVVALLLAYGGGLYYLAVGIPGLGYGGHPELVPVGWRELGSQIGRVAADIENRAGTPPLIIGMDRYAIASELAFYGGDPAKSVAQTSSAHLFGQVGLMYERWFPPSEQRGRTLLLVAWDPKDLIGGDVASSVERLGPLEEGVLRRKDNAFVRRYYYRIGYGYRGIAGPR